MELQNLFSDLVGPRNSDCDCQTLVHVVKANCQSVLETIANNLRTRLGMDASDRTIYQKVFAPCYHGHTVSQANAHIHLEWCKQSLGCGLMEGPVQQ